MLPAARHRRLRAALVASGLLLLVVACGSASDSVANQATTEAPTDRIGCPNGPFFSPAVLERAPQLLAESSVPDVALAIAPFLEGGEGQFWPQDEWRVLDVVPGDRAELVHLGSAESPQLAFMGADWSGDQWRWAGSSSFVDCELVREPATDESVVDWVLRPVGPNDTVIALEATERSCASGQPMGDRLGEAEVIVSADEVRIVLTAVPPDGETQTCPGNPSQLVTIELDEPLGDREVVDGRTTGLGDLRDLLLALVNDS